MRDENYDVTLYLDDSRHVEALEVSLRVVGDRRGVYNLAREPSGIVQDIRLLGLVGRSFFLTG